MIAIAQSLKQLVAIQIARRWLLFQTLREHRVNRKDLRALTLLGPTQDNPIPSPLTVLHLDNRLYIILC